MNKEQIESHLTEIVKLFTYLDFPIESHDLLTGEQSHRLFQLFAVLWNALLQRRQNNGRIHIRTQFDHFREQLENSYISHKYEKKWRNDSVVFSGDQTTDWGGKWGFKCWKTVFFSWVLFSFFLLAYKTHKTHTKTNHVSQFLTIA